MNEILIAMGIIGMLTSIVIVAMNPTENLLSAQHAKRRVYNREQMNAIFQYWQDNGHDPAENIPTGLDARMPICRPGITDDPTCVNLDALTENQTYLVAIPLDVTEAEYDTNYTGYMIYQLLGADVFVCNYYLPPTDEQYCQGPATYYAGSSSLSGGMTSNGSSSSGFSSAGLSSSANGCNAQIGIRFDSVTNLGAGNAQPYLYVDSTILLHSGQYTNLVVNGSPVIDPPGLADRPGPYLERRNGYVRFLDYGYHPSESDQEWLEGQLLFNGATITSIDTLVNGDGLENQGDNIIDVPDYNDEFKADGTFGMNVSIATDYVDVYYTCTGAASSASTSAVASAAASSSVWASSSWASSSSAWSSTAASAAASSSSSSGLGVSSAASSSSADGGLSVNCMEIAGECIAHCGVTINPGDGKYCADVIGNPEAYTYICNVCISIE